MDADKLPYCMCVLVINFFMIVIIIGFQAPIALKNNHEPFSGDLILLFSIIFLFEAIFFGIYVIRETE